MEGGRVPTLGRKEQTVTRHRKHVECLRSKNTWSRCPDQSAELKLVVTNTLIVADMKRSVAFYRDVLAATVLREGQPMFPRFGNIYGFEAEVQNYVYSPASLQRANFSCI